MAAKQPFIKFPPEEEITTASRHSRDAGVIFTFLSNSF